MCEFGKSQLESLSVASVSGMSVASVSGMSVSLATGISQLPVLQHGSLVGGGERCDEAGGEEGEGEGGGREGREVAVEGEEEDDENGMNLVPKSGDGAAAKMSTVSPRPSTSEGN